MKLKINLPILLTLMRVVMIPFVVLLYYIPQSWFSSDPDTALLIRNSLATAGFVLAAVTDWLDGWLARKWNQTSAFGAFLDPVADKLMVTASLLVLVQFYNLGTVFMLMALIIIGREITISALREWMASVGARKSVAVNWLGKIKTIVQMVAIPCLLFYKPLLGIDFHVLGYLLMVMATALTVWSMFTYMRAALPALDLVDEPEAASQEGVKAADDQALDEPSHKEG